MEKIKEFFKKYVNLANIMKIWESGISKDKVLEIVDKLFGKADVDGNLSIQVKDLILAIIEKIMKK